MCYLFNYHIAQSIKTRRRLHAYTLLCKAIYLFIVMVLTLSQRSTAPSKSVFHASSFCLVAEKPDIIVRACTSSMADEVCSSAQHGTGKTTKKMIRSTVVHENCLGPMGFRPHAGQAQHQNWTRLLKTGIFWLVRLGRVWLPEYMVSIW
jgi:hypothetical protein